MMFSNTNRRGRMAVPHSVIKQARIVNLLPVCLRTINGVTVDKFKGELYKFLSGVPDEPTIPGRGKAASSISLFDQLELQFLLILFTGWRPLSKGQQLITFEIFDKETNKKHDTTPLQQPVTEVKTQ